MSITSYLDEFDADPETKRVLEVALKMTRLSLGLADASADGITAKRIMELAEAGERNPGFLCEGALKKLRGHLYSAYPAIIQAAPAPPRHLFARSFADQ